MRAKNTHSQSKTSQPGGAKFAKTTPLASRSVVPIIRMRRQVACQILRTIGANQPETGGILLGPVGSNDITDFYFDVTAKCGGVTYEPDIAVLRQKMINEWIPQQIDMKGFCHSHPGRFDQLSRGDLVYIQRLLAANPDMPFFSAPIVIPQDYRWRAVVVLRDQPDKQHATCFQLY